MKRRSPSADTLVGDFSFVFEEQVRVDHHKDLRWEVGEFSRHDNSASVPGLRVLPPKWDVMKLGFKNLVSRAGAFFLPVGVGRSERLL